VGSSPKRVTLSTPNPVCPKPCNPGFSLNPAPLIGGGDGGEGCIGGKGARACQEGNPVYPKPSNYNAYKV